ncbi:MAG: MBL fold metallo-hydrolase [Candidatus Marinimicrobia bacterium]|nr:MBL fold metallo-hydrolase [Candidatus Neomarinimicrobiota bacterium]
MQEEFESDIITTSGGDLKLTFIGHASLMFEFNHKIIHIDPVLQEADYSTLPAADLILITHEHFDHLDEDAIKRVINKRTQLIYTRKCSDQVTGGKVLNNGAKIDLEWIKIEVVPAYNIVHERSPGKPFHPQGVGNGYVLTIADKRIYVAGDTENIPEMKALENIDIAFLPMNLPYTMTPEMVADAARVFRPEILYPYHYGSTDPRELVKLLEDEKDIEVRIRQLQ